MVKEQINLTAIFVQDPTSGGYTVFFAQLPNIIAEGSTKDEATHNLFQTVQAAFEHQMKIELDAAKIDALKSSVTTQSFKFAAA